MDDSTRNGTPAPTLELLDWVASRPRTYPETIDAWRSSCPRLTIWEDAVRDGLVAIRRSPGEPSSVSLTERGQVLLGHR